MQQTLSCPVNPNNDPCESYGTNGDRDGFVCAACGGRFEIARPASRTYFRNLSDFQRAVLSHQLNTASRSSTPVIDMNWMEHFERDARLPSPPEQATNLIRLIGDHLSKTGEGYRITGEVDVARVGSFNLTTLTEIRKELEKRDILQGLQSGYGLTLDGWKLYEAERHGQVVGSYGFIAMKFNDGVLDDFVKKTVKPAVQNGIGYDLVDLRDVSRGWSD